MLFAYKSLTWKGGSALDSGDWGHIYDGNIGVNYPAPDLTTIVLNFGTTYRGIMSPGSQAVGDSVRADDVQDVFYYLFANRLNASFGGTVMNPNPNPAYPKGNYPWTTPIIPTGLLPALPFTPFSTLAAFQAAAGANYVAPFIVAAGTTFTLDPTKWYGGIDVRDGATIVLNSATYRVWDFTAIGKNVTFQVTDSSVLNVDVHFNPNDGFKFGIGTNSGAHLNVGAATTAYANSNNRVTVWSNKPELHVQYFAPTGWLDLGNQAKLYGRYWAQTITGDPNDNAYCAGG